MARSVSQANSSRTSPLGGVRLRACGFEEPVEILEWRDDHAGDEVVCIHL